MTLAGLISALAGTFGLAFFWFIGAIPAGVALGVNPVLVAVTAWLSYVAGVVLVVLLGEPIRVRLMKRFAGKGEDNSKSRIRQVWDRYGVIGLGLLAPITVGSQIGAALGLTLGAKPRQLLVGMALGAAAWTIGITVATVLGVTAITGGK